MDAWLTKLGMQIILQPFGLGWWLAVQPFGLGCGLYPNYLVIDGRWLFTRCGLVLNYHVVDDGLLTVWIKDYHGLGTFKDRHTKVRAHYKNTTNIFLPGIAHAMRQQPITATTCNKLKAQTLKPRLEQSTTQYQQPSVYTKPHSNTSTRHPPQQAMRQQLLPLTPNHTRILFHQTPTPTNDAPTTPTTNAKTTPEYSSTRHSQPQAMRQQPVDQIKPRHRTPVAG